MSIPIYEDEVTIDPKDGTIRLKATGEILEENGVWKKRNYYLTTRENERNSKEGADRATEKALATKDEKFERKTSPKKADKIKAGTQKVTWWAKLREHWFGKAKGNSK